MDELTPAEQAAMAIEATQIDLDHRLAERAVTVVERWIEKLELQADMTSESKMELLGHAIDLLRVGGFR